MAPEAEQPLAEAVDARTPEATEDAEADPAVIARTVALRKLTAQARTRHELTVALRARNVPENAAIEALDRLGEVGLVDDAAFAEDWVTSRQQRRHRSRSALRHELQRKGVARELIDQALDAVDSDAEYRAALDLARRKHATMSGLEPTVCYRRLAGTLARRGFGSATTAHVLREVLGGVVDDI
jgi:regulatory protein